MILNYPNSANTYFIPLEDIQVAAEFTKIAYLHGDAVSTSNGFTIVETIHESLDENNEIKIVVAENVDERIIAFRGVNGYVKKSTSIENT